MFRKASVCILVSVFTCGILINNLFPQNNDGLSEQIKKNKKLQLNVQRVVEYLIRNNFDVKKEFLKYKGASSGLRNFLGKYDPNLTGSAGYAQTQSYNTMVQKNMAVEVSNYSAGVSKSFDTGTSVKATVNGMYQTSDSVSMTIPGMGKFPLGGGDLYNTGIRVEVTQELLKNFFGHIDRLSEKQLENLEKMNRQYVKMNLAVLLVNAVIGYWSMAIAEETLKTNESNYRSTADIRDLIQRKLVLGLAEREDSLEWDGNVLASRNNRDLSEKVLFDARLMVLRTLDLDSSLDIELEKTFRTTKPDVTTELALKDAFMKRIDWNNQKIILKNAELEYAIASNNENPSLKLKLSAGSQDYDTGAYSGTLDKINREYAIGLEMSYPLGNTAAESRMRDARLNWQKEEVNFRSMEKAIRDEIASVVNECEVNYRVYLQTMASREYKQNYYNQVLAKFQRGRYSAIQLKLALDGYTVSRLYELQSLVNYNISLLKRDLSRNVIFENFGIDVDGILKRLEN